MRGKVMSVERNDRFQDVCTRTNSSAGEESTDAFAIGPRFLRGEVLAGRFEIVRFIARGGMGEVYEAQDRLLQNSHVALKTILPAKALEPDARLHLKEEVMLARQVTHPNVCPIYDLFECERPEQTCFLTMKLLTGETLAQRIRSRPIAGHEAVQIARQLCDGLRAAHRAGVVHRDLKPGNIMLDGSGTNLKAVITDFGIAFEYEPDRTVLRNAVVVGTPGYIAPEMHQGEPASPASDLYALGVVLHELFTGHKPPSEGVGKAARPAPELQKRHTPAWCLRLIAGCLNAVPKTREQEFQRALEYLGLDDTAPIGMERKPVLTRRKLLAGAAFATAAAAGGVAWREDVVENWLHPLPRKRFVALLNFPPTTDAHVKPLVSGVIEAIESELSRAEAFDRDLFVMAARQAPPDRAGLAGLRGSLGTNLVLAAQGTVRGNSLQLLLKVIDVTSSAVLRFQSLAVSEADIPSSTRKAVLAAAHLLNVRLPSRNQDQPSSATNSEEAYRAFQTAEELMKQPNDAGLAKAMENYRAAVDADPKYAMAYAKLALAYCRFYALHSEPAALELARRNAETALKFEPNLIIGHIALSDVYDEEGQKQRALEEIRRALDIDPSNPRTLFFQAQIYYRMNRWSDAERIYHRLLDQRPNSWSAYNDLGFVLNAQGKYRDAIEAFRSATLVNPHSSLALNNLAGLQFKNGDLDQAKQNYVKSLELSANDQAYSGLGATLRAEGNYNSAIICHMKAVDINPADDTKWLDLGDCYESMRKKKEARDAYSRAKQEVERALQVDASDSGAWLRLALYKIKTGQAGDALKLLDKAGNTESLDLDSRVIQARLYELLGKRGQALSTLQACFVKGLTPIEIADIHDFSALKKDPEYLKISNRR